LRTRISAFVAVIQTIIFLTHAFIYATCVFFWEPDSGQLVRLRIVLACLSVSFVAAQLLAFRFYNPLARLCYKLAAIWLGTLNFLFLASLLCWIAYLPLAVSGHDVIRRDFFAPIFALAFLLSAYSIANAARLRITHVSVQLPSLPSAWRGRVAALITDTHLGHVRGPNFAARIAAKLQALRPDVIFFSGDLFDGTKADLASLVAPWKNLSPPLGAYFATGNHESFSDPTKYIQATAAYGIRILQNEKVVVEGLQIVGVSYLDSTDPGHYGRTLERFQLDRTRPSVLLLHVPYRLDISEKAGISLQVSGHTHGGQIFPFTFFTRRIFREFVHGLHRFGSMWVYTSYGAGTWGPPLRFLTWPEITLIRFE